MEVDMIMICTTVMNQEQIILVYA